MPRDRTLDDLDLAGRRDPEGLRDVLTRLVAGARDVLGDEFVGAYLQGSLAAGDFENLSDVDFIVAVREDVSEDTMLVLQDFHRSLFDHPSYWAWHLEGSYVPLDALATLPPPHRKLLYIDHGATSFERSDHDHYLAVLWILRERGVTLAGPPARTLIPPIPEGALEAEVRRTMLDWGAELLAMPDEEIQRWLQSFAVLTYCRMAHTLETGEVRSKRAGRAWAKGVLDGRWHGVIDRAWKGRVKTSEGPQRPADPDAVLEMRAFVRHVLETIQ
jgi:hypothetical protein